MVDSWVSIMGSYVRKNWILLFIIFVLAMGILLIFKAAVNYQNDANRFWARQFIDRECRGIPESYDVEFNVSAQIDAWLGKDNRAAQNVSFCEPYPQSKCEQCVCSS